MEAEGSPIKIVSEDLLNNCHPFKKGGGGAIVK